MIFNPEIYSAKWAACVPISPMHPLLPLFLGSVLQAACALPSLSDNLLNHPCGYSTHIFLIFPNAPPCTIARACFTRGYPEYVCVKQRNHPVSSTFFFSCFALSSVNVIGFSIT